MLRYRDATLQLETMLLRVPMLMLLGTAVASGFRTGHVSISWLLLTRNDGASDGHILNMVDSGS